MKKRFTRILAALALLVFMIPFTGWGQTRTEVVAYTLEPATGSNNSYTGNCDITINDITWNLTGNSQQIPWRIGGKSISGVDRALYSKTAISDNISKIEVTHGAASSITVNSWTVIVSENADFSDPVSTLTPTFAANTTTTINRPNDADWSNCYYKFVYNVTVSGSSNKFLEFTEAVFYKEGGSAPAVAAPTFSPAGGNYTSTQNVTISCETQGSTIYYTIDGSAPDNTSTQYNDAITVSETTTIKAIAYVGNDASSVASATYTIMQPLTTMQAIFNKATEVGSTATNVYVTFSNWVVVGKNSSNVYVTDGQYGLVIYQNNHGFNMGDKLSGTVACQVQLYNGGAELKGITASTQGLTVTQNATIEPYEISLTNITGEYIGSYVDLGQLEYNGSVFTDGENTIQPYNTFSVSGFNVNNLVSNKTYNVKGAYIVYGNNQTKEIAPRDLNDITEVVGTDPILSVDPTSLSFTYTQGATEVPSKDFTITGSNLTENVIVTLPAGNFTMYDGNDAITSSLTLIPNEGAINKTITVKMNAGLEQGSDYNGTITIEWEGEEDLTIELTGTVTEPEPENVTWDLTIASFTEIEEDVVTWSSDYATMTNVTGTSTTHANSYIGGSTNNGNLCDHTRFYQGQVLTITPADGYAINSIEITATDNTYAGYYLNNATWTNATVQVSGTVVNVTPTLGNTAVSVTFGKATRATQVTVYYEEYTATPHNVTVDNEIEHGTITANPTSAIAGATVTLTIAPEQGYYLAENNIVTEPTVELTKVDEETYTFTMPDEDILVSAEFTAIPTEMYQYSINGVEGELNEVTQGTVITLAECNDINETYVFVGWTTDASNFTNILTAGSSYTIDETVEFFAVYGKQSASTASMTIDKDTPNFPTSYGNANTFTEYTLNGKKFMIQQAYINGSKLQFRASGNSNGTGTIYNNEDFGTITSIVLNYNSSDNNKNFTVHAGSEANPTEGTEIEPDFEEGGSVYTFDMSHGNYTYFVLTNGTNAGYLDNIIINYTGLVLSDYYTIVKFKEVAAYQGAKDGYVLVASPVSTTPDDAGMITDELGAQATPETATYDLYYFDQAQSLEWINYRQGGFNTIEPGKGYLYANKNNVTLTFAGEAYDGDGYIELTYEDGAEFAGWNLIGNPFGTEATLDKPYFRLVEGATELTAADESAPVNAMEGVFVSISTDDLDPETGLCFAKFTTASKSSQHLALNLSRNERSASVIDRAIVRFDGGLTLPKFQLNPNNTKVYIPQGNKDYAVVRSAAEAEMPVSFRASENGTYTLAVEAENVEMNYLHLIDNLTGMDVDLLQTPSYTFEAKTSDYASRFRLVFKANGTNENNAETFAYFNGTNWTVSNVGEATLQVVDVTGRTVANQMINGNAELNLNQPAGVYVIRLVNGDNVKTQKVVVR